MSFNLNQFKLSNNAGEVMNPAANVIQAQVLPTLATTSYLIAGDVVTFGTAVGDMPIVRKAYSGHTGAGIVVYNMKKDKYYANDILGIALDGSIITAIAGAAITRNDVVGWGSNSYVTTIASGNGIGIALDSASAADDIIRVLVKAGIAYNSAL